jgi:hypothetical protein
MKIHADHIEWGPYVNAFTKEIDYQFYFYFVPNWLKPDNRHVGLMRLWHDGPHVLLGFWWFNISWSGYGSTPPFEFCSLETQMKWKKRPPWLRKLWAMEAYEETPSLVPGGN